MNDLKQNNITEYFQNEILHSYFKSYDLPLRLSKPIVKNITIEIKPIIKFLRVLLDENIFPGIIISIR